MAIEEMELVTIVGLMSELDSVLLKCCESGCFHMEPAFVSASESHGLKLLNDKNPYDVPLKGLASIATSLGIKLKETDFSDCALESGEDFSLFCDRLEKPLAELSEKKQKALQIISERKGAVIQLNHLKGLNEEFDRIFSCRHVAVRVGKLPLESREKLEFYDQEFFFVPFDTDRSFCWGMYFCPREIKDIVDDLFKSMYFERIVIPDFVTGNTAEAFERLNAEIGENVRMAEEYDESLSDFAKEHEDEIQRAFTKLKFKHDTFDLRKNVGALKDKIYIKGFIPKKNHKSFEKLFEDSRTVSVVYMPPDADASCTPPTVLKNSWFTRPFGMLVEMYGLPDYGGFNPTGFVAITYSLLFGIMFGDLGQGFLVFLLGLFVGRKMSPQMGGMMSRVGISSMIFGTLYGSVFGFEELLDPVYESLGIDFLPLKIFKQTNFILLTAVAIGIALIVVSIIINIYVGFKQKDYERAVFGCNGIAGLVFYTSVVVGVVGTMLMDIHVMSTPFVIFLIVIPALCIFCRVPFAAVMKYREFRLSEDGEKMTVGNFIVENFFEMFEYVLSYVSNTMSFLRVGGFVLSHAGMMLVVMTLMDGAALAAQPLVAVVGNAFVMVMEGMIVAIQIIRLEFYEIFSRFYDGNGKPFDPIGVRFSPQVD
ncbi:V-type ATPase 116kDa subunit family protein [Ruminococcus sp. Marseille-P6503]|uniref:V-type ATP synthase subunit I n=1 Tax=Ruminococcus sp. Marseille-P6503 TaxID=2364796 RepID=UPI000F522574|nr:V-type ATPase 116kDa subunit family protein [Ruminococcus sp. Marseille-P6503]